MNSLPIFQNLDDWQNWLTTQQLQGTPSFKKVLQTPSIRSLEGQLNLTLLPRLRAALYRPEADASLSFTWILDRSTRPLPQCILSVKSNNTQSWQLVCQRCLSPISWTLDSSSTFWIAENETQFEELGIDPEDEAFFHDESVVLLQHIEDEALLALPYSPRHPENQCKITTPQDKSEQDKPHPFAGLIHLKGTSK